MNQRVLRIYKRVMSVPEGLSGKEHKRLVRKYVKEMSASELDDIESRSIEIEEESWEEWRLRKEILLALGFSDGETQVLARCRLNSPGIRTLIKERVEITKHATDEEIKEINEGSRSTLRALIMLYRRNND